MAMVQRELTLFLSPSAASWKALKIRKTKGRVFHRRLCYQELPLHHSQRMIRAMVKGGLSGVANMLRRKTLQILSNLPLVIGEMFAVASLMALAEAIRKQEFSESLPRPSIQDVSTILMGAGYEVFLKGPSLYAFQGLAGRLAPVGVHIALLLIMAGGTLSACGSFRGSVTVPQGLNFVVYDVLAPSGFLSSPTDAFNTEIHVNKFYMDYYEWRDWSISAMQILKDNEGPYNLAMAPLQINGDKKLFGTYLPAGDINSPDVKGISMLARDLQSIVLYDKEGKFAGVTWPKSKLPINIDGSEIVIVDAIGSSGLDLKIWALQDGTAVFVGVKTNRAKMEFPEEMNRLLDKVPEIVESSLPKQADSISG
ncbi:hypothetical protein JHK87_032744 [Glycine soja]|nr:hypothetical protein JHK87_032744 [Glycine soja]